MQDSKHLLERKEMGEEQTEEAAWYVMRDLRRPNAKVRAYQQLADEGFEVFTPMHWVVTNMLGRRERKYVPVINDLLFVHSLRSELDSRVAAIDALQYRFAKGAQAKPLTVRDAEMTAFVRACSGCDDVRYYQPEEITPDMIGKPIKIFGGTLDGLEGTLMSMRGSRKKRLLVQLPGILAAAVEVVPAYIQEV